MAFVDEHWILHLVSQTVTAMAGLDSKVTLERVGMGAFTSRGPVRSLLAVRSLPSHCRSSHAPISRLRSKDLLTTLTL